jgi:hypothetical protein
MPSKGSKGILQESAVGFPVLDCDPLDVPIYLKKMNAKYDWGSKPDVKLQLHDIKALDCSALTKIFVYKLTGGAVLMPDGSVNQRAWCEEQGFKETTVEAAVGQKDGILRIGFWNAGGTKRHVWFVLNGRTYESHGRTKGPDSRRFDGKAAWQRDAKMFVLALPKGV